MKGQKAFAAVSCAFRREGYVNLWSVRPQASQVRNDAMQYSGLTWPELKKLGWRVCSIRVCIHEREI